MQPCFLKVLSASKSMLLIKDGVRLNICSSCSAGKALGTQKWERATITYLRLGFKLLVEPQHEASVCVCVGGWFSAVRSGLVQMCSRLQLAPTSLPRMDSPKRDHSRGKKPQIRKNGIITCLKAKNTKCSIHHLSVTMQEAGRRKGARSGRRAPV